MRSNSAGRRGLFDDVAGPFLLASLTVFALFLWASYRMEEASSYLLPRGLAILGIGVASIHLALGYWRPREAQREDGGKNEGVHVFTSIVFATAYFCLVPVLGFLLATALAIAGFSYVADFPGKRVVAALAVVIPILLHLTFVELLKAPLPAGFVGALPF